jgi:hypothetical protein
MKRRSSKIGLAAIVAVVVVWALAWTVQNVRALRAAEALSLELQAAGLPIRPEGLRREPPLAPEENAALLYEAAFALRKSVAAPEGAFESIEERPPRLTSEDRALLPAYDEALALVHRAARLPACDFEIRYEDGFSALVLHLFQLRELATTLAARALARAEEGRVEEAVDDVRALFATSRALRSEPLLVSQLVRCAMSERALLVLEAILPRAPSAAAAVQRAEPDTAAGALETGLRGELVNVLSLVDGEVLARYRAQRGVPRELLPCFLELPGYRANAVTCARVLSRLAAAKGEWLDLVRQAEALEREAGGIGLFDSWAGHCASWVRSFARLESRVRLARLAALFLDHRRATGAYPPTVDALGGARDLVDPLTGEPFALRADGEWLVLHSRWEGPGKWKVDWRLPAGD